MNGSAPRDGWDDYLTGFHAGRAGITERILARCADTDGTTAYDWVAERIPATGLVVDVACGSSPLWNPRLAGRYLGIDRSPAELQLAEKRGAHALIRGAAETLPVADGAAAAVVCSMALQILPDLPATLAEIRRALAPGGEFVAILPARAEGPGDLAFAAGLARAAGGTLGYRNDAVLRRPSALFSGHGLTVTEDTRRTFRYDLSTPGAPAQAAASLYLRGSQAGREGKIAAYLERAARHGRTMPVPIRRILATPARARP